MTRVAVLLVALLVAAQDVHAEWRMGVSAYAGRRVLDEQLDDYRWDVEPAPVLGVEGLARRGRAEFAVAVERSSTQQALGLPGTTVAPRVDLTQVALRTRFDFFSLGPLHFSAGGGLGRMHLGWQPDAVQVEVEGIAAPLEIEYAPVNTWRREVAIGAEWALTHTLSLGLIGEHSWFELDTAHRAGDTIVDQTETFSSLDFRLHLKWTFAARTEATR